MRGLRRRFGGRPRPATAGTLDDLLAERIGSHFDLATVDGTRVSTGLAGIEVTGQVADTGTWGTFQHASLYFNVHGGAFGPDPAFASISGYADESLGREDDVARAVVEGACLWTCTLRSIARSAFTNEAPDPTAAVRDVAIHDRRFRLHVDRIDRAVALEGATGEPDPSLYSSARRRVSPSGWLLEAAADAGTLPPLVSDRATLVSAFASRADDGPDIAEVKVRGADWTPAHDAIRIPEVGQAGVLLSLRELGILVPLEPALLDRPTVERSLAAIAANRAEDGLAAGWRGWRSHGGRLDDPMRAGDLEALEGAVGRLPDAFRSFLLAVAGSGAGPGYGVLVPRLVEGVIPLAHAGCGVFWVLRLDGQERGEVWIDARACDDSYRPVAPTFEAWYADWLDASFGSAIPWTHWESLACACAHTLAQALEAAATGERVEHRLHDGAVASVSLQSGGGLLPAGTPLDPSHACIALYESWGIGEQVFTSGAESPATAPTWEGGR